MVSKLVVALMKCNEQKLAQQVSFTIATRKIRKTTKAEYISAIELKDLKKRIKHKLKKAEVKHLINMLRRKLGEKSTLHTEEIIHILELLHVLHTVF